MKQVLKLNATLFTLLGFSSAMGALTHNTSPLISLGVAVSAVVALIGLNKV